MRYLPIERQPTSIVRRTATGNGSTTGFTVSNGLTADKVVVDVNGIVQIPTTNYTVSGTTLTFDSAPVSGHVIQIIELPV
jgi:hypothetical protein|tara:strand:+ start:268 stop:507 length:240 start_codon:yes stop_codon:yes gene_type:complete